MKGPSMGSKEVRFCEFVVRDAIVPELEAKDRNGVIAELVESLVKAGAVEARIAQEVIAEVIKREMKGSTGFGKGVAVPHAKQQVALRAAVVGEGARAARRIGMARQAARVPVPDHPGVSVCFGGHQHRQEQAKSQRNGPQQRP